MSASSCAIAIIARHVRASIEALIRLEMLPPLHAQRTHVIGHGVYFVHGNNAFKLQLALSLLEWCGGIEMFGTLRTHGHSGSPPAARQLLMKRSQACSASQRCFS